MEKKPSLQFKEYLKENRSMNGAIKSSYSLWLDKYVKKKDSKPQEKFSKELVPGKMYTFAYMGREKLDKKIMFVDHRPVMMSLGRVFVENKPFETGIDLNVIPFKPRLMILDQIYKFYGKVIKENWENLNENKSGKKAMKINYDMAKKMLKGTGWERAYLMFDPNGMQKVETVDYQDWAPMCAVYTKAIRGMQIKDIWDKYIKNISRPVEEPVFKKANNTISKNK